MAVLINKETGKAEDVQQPDFATHGIPLLDPNGQQVTADSIEDARRLVQFYGHKQLGPEAAGQLLQKAKYGEQTGKAALEAIARGVAGPVATQYEKKLGVNPEDILGREENNPKAAMAGEIAGLAGSALTGTGEGHVLGLLGDAAKAQITEKLGTGFASKLLGKAAAGAVENAAYQSGVEAHRMIAEDPAASAENAISHVGLAAAIGGGIGGVFGLAGSALESKAASNAGKFISDARAKLLDLANNPEPVDALHQELSTVHDALKDTGEAFGLKKQEMAKLIPTDELATQRIATQAQDITSKFEDVIDKVRNKPGMDAVATQIDQDLQEFKHAVGESGSVGTFDAINTLKRKFDTYSFYKHQDFTPGANFKPMAHDFRRYLIDALENKEVFGQAAERHAAFNKAYSQFKTPLEEFQKTFGATLNGKPVVDPGKIATYLKQLGNPNAEIKQDRMLNFLDSLDTFKGQLRKTHENLGISTEELDALHTPHAHKTLEDLSAGARFANMFIKHGLGKTAGGILGGVTGATMGHPFVGMALGSKLFGSEFNKVLPAIIKPMLERDINPGAMRNTIAYAAAAMKGESALNKGISAVLTGAKEVVPSPKSSDIDKLKARLDKIAKNPSDMQNVGSGIGSYMPEHSGHIAATAARGVEYLQSLKPHDSQLGPLDTPAEPNKFENARYEQALEIAQAPLTVLPKIQNGTLTVNNIKDLNAIYPGLMPRMQQKLVAQMVEHKASGKHVPYKTQLGMSLFLGQPLSATMTPQSIMATQTALAPASTHAPQAPKQPHSARSMTALAKMPNSLKTPSDAVASRRQNR